MAERSLAEILEGKKRKPTQKPVPLQNIVPDTTQKPSSLTVNRPLPITPGIDVQKDAGILQKIAEGVGGSAAAFGSGLLGSVSFGLAESPSDPMAEMNPVNRFIAESNRDFPLANTIGGIGGDVGAFLAGGGLVKLGSKGLAKLAAKKGVGGPATVEALLKLADPKSISRSIATSGVVTTARQLTEPGEFDFPELLKENTINLVADLALRGAGKTVGLAKRSFRGGGTAPMSDVEAYYGAVNSPIRAATEDEVATPIIRRYTGASVDVNRELTNIESQRIASIPTKAKGGQLYHITPAATYISENFGKDAMDLFWHPLKRIEGVVSSDYKRMTDGLNAMTKRLFRTNAERREASIRIDRHFLEQTPQGLRILRRMGIKDKVVLTRQEREAAEFIRGKYDAFWDKINEVHKAYGLSSVGRLKDYSPLMREGTDHFDSSISNALQSRGKSVPPEKFFPHLQTRLGSDAPVVLDAFGGFQNYSYGALRHIHMTPEALWSNGVTEAMPKSDLKRALVGMYNSALGVDVVPIPKKGRDFLFGIHRNNIAGSLFLNMGTVLVQPTVLVNVYSELGGKWAVRGAGWLFSKKKMAFALKKSPALASRVIDPALDQAPRATSPFGTLIASAVGPKAALSMKSKKDIANHFGSHLLRQFDSWTAISSWGGAYEKAIRMGLDEKGAIQWADNMLILTNGSGSPVDIAPIQRGAIGRLATPFMTFGIAQFDYLRRIAGGDGSTQRVARYLVGSYLMNKYSEMLGLNSGMFNPIYSMTRDREKNAFPLPVTKNAPDPMKSLAEDALAAVPFVSGARYPGSSPLGANVQLGADAARLIVNPDPLNVLSVGGRLAGIPGSMPLVSSIKKVKKREKEEGRTKKKKQKQMNDLLKGPR